jgi:hypothetical protein
VKAWSELDLPRSLRQPPQIKAEGRRGSGWVYALSAVVGGLLSYLVLTAVQNTDLAKEALRLSGMHAAGFALVVVFMVWVAILLHEAGHLLGARLGRLRPLLLMAGPLWIHFEDRRRPQIRLNRTASTWGGLTVVLPQVQQGRQEQQASAWQPGAMALMVAGGPLVSLATGVVAMAAAVALGSGIAALTLASLSLISALIGVGTLMPMSGAGYHSDGANLWQLFRRDPEVGHRLTLACVAASAYCGTRPRDWPIDVLQAVAAHTRSNMTRASALLLRAQALDDAHPAVTNDPEHPALLAYAECAEVLHAGGFAACPAAFRSAIALAVGLFIAQRLTCASAAAAWIQAGQGGVVPVHDRLHAQAALAWAQGDLTGAREGAGKAVSMLRSATSNGVERMTLDRLRELIKHCVNTIKD